MVIVGLCGRRMAVAASKAELLVCGGSIFGMVLPLCGGSHWYAAVAVEAGR